MTRRAIWAVLAGGIVSAASAASPVLRFERTKLSNDSYEAASVADINHDGKPDIGNALLGFKFFKYLKNYGFFINTCAACDK